MACHTETITSHRRAGAEQGEHHTREQGLHPEEEQHAGQRGDGEPGYQMPADEESVGGKLTGTATGVKSRGRTPSRVSVDASR
jgi:hypothetical protein